MTSLKEENARLQEQMDNIENYSWKNNIIITGILWTREEEVRNVVLNTAAKLGVKINNDDITAAQRLPSKSQTPPIITKFIKYETKPLIIAASKKFKLRGTSLGHNSISKIYSDEHLKARQVLEAAKDLRRKGVIRFVWTRNRNVRIWIGENSPVLIVCDLEQLEQAIVNEYEKQDIGNGGKDKTRTNERAAGEERVETRSRPNNEKIKTPGKEVNNKKTLENRCKSPASPPKRIPRTKSIS